MKPQSLILVLDFGSQYTHLIARRIRELGVYSEIVSYSYPIEKIKKRKPCGLVFSGGPNSVYLKDSPIVKKEIYDLRIPILGICYGMHLTGLLLDGKVTKGTHKEYGPMKVRILDHSDIFDRVSKSINVWMSHGDQVTKLPPGFVKIAESENTPITAMADLKRKIYCLQFHPEVTHTQEGMKILGNFIYEICQCQKSWKLGDFINDSITNIRKKIGNRRAICALSGGVDSAVAATLVYHAIGNNLTCIYVDNGLMRLGETEEVVKVFRQHQKMKLVVVDAKEHFLSKLKGITAPEEKRKTIGEEFIRVFEREAKKIGKVDYLVQGTIYPDVITSGVSVGGKAAVIKSHHNVGGLPEKLGLKLIEPLRELYKDEVRKIGLKLGLPKEQVYRHPFPGPGLAVRIIGEITDYKLDIVRRADSIAVEEVRKAGWYEKLWIIFAIFPGVKTVGVKGDDRAYGELIAIRCLVSRDAMTGNWAHFPPELLDRISSRITNEVHEVTRVVYDITNKPPGTMEWE